MNSKPKSKITTITFPTSREAWRTAYCAMIVAGVCGATWGKRFLQAKAAGRIPALPAEAHSVQLNLALALAEVAGDAFAPELRASLESGQAAFGVTRSQCREKALKVGLELLAPWLAESNTTTGYHEALKDLVLKTWHDLVAHILETEFYVLAWGLAEALFEGTDDYEPEERTLWVKASLRNAPKLQLNGPPTNLSGARNVAEAN